MAAIARRAAHFRTGFGTRRAAATVAALTPLLALALSCLDGIVVVAASQFFGAAAGLR
ncbi:hypothetical protein [Chenggangzhangella methanolivorans]|uniref:Uncharacterized protein n=1 Tax=Chenggangzhangella methanolivorans TaxID=1437009 RepID=A0A9E6RB95_9HYPH|nr:hypothetical protein [Chenggangzhangella methanolivorans]QZO01586.1 hypothetical protein K6K41_09350 [Chenggangzhangella methanolivorans]